MNSYEMLYILDNDLSDEMKEKLVNKFNDVITKANGTIDTVDKWGTKKLAYDINYKSEGYYLTEHKHQYRCKSLCQYSLWHIKFQHTDALTTRPHHCRNIVRILKR